MPFSNVFLLILVNFPYCCSSSLSVWVERVLIDLSSTRSLISVIDDVDQSAYPYFSAQVCTRRFSSCHLSIFFIGMVTLTLMISPSLKLVGRFSPNLTSTNRFWVPGTGIEISLLSFRSKTLGS